jgi:Flp pilus assembly protein TadD
MAAQTSPKDPYVQAMVGRYYQAIGHTGSAIKHLVIAYELNPNEPGVAYDLGVLGQQLPPR